MSDMRSVFRKMIVVTLLFAAAGLTACGGKKYWNPTGEQMIQAEEVARKLAYDQYSDQAKKPATENLPRDAKGLLKEIPIVFSIQDVPFHRYKPRFWGANEKGRKVIHVDFADPDRMPDWQDPKATAEFPVLVPVTVDLEQLGP